MISKKTLKEYEFKCIEDYFNYIIESKINGNYSQVKDLIKNLSKEQKRDFIAFIKDCPQDDDNDYIILVLESC